MGGASGTKIDRERRFPYDSVLSSYNDVPGPGAYTKVHKSDVRYGAKPKSKRPMRSVGLLTAANVLLNSQRNLKADRAFIDKSYQDKLRKIENMS